MDEKRKEEIWYGIMNNPGYSRNVNLNKKKNTVSIGNAGEYFVAGELERRGFTVAVPMSNTELFDVLAIERSTNKQIAIQVKTTSYRKKEWSLGLKNETLIGDNIFYILVGNKTDLEELIQVSIIIFIYFSELLHYFILDYPMEIIQY